jgi:hypothetical protein
MKVVVNATANRVLGSDPIRPTKYEIAEFEQSQLPNPREEDWDRVRRMVKIDLIIAQNDVTLVSGKVRENANK